MARTVGQFTLHDDGSLEGPAQYLQEQGNAFLTALLDGTNAAFNMSAHLSPDIETAVLVFLQTDYAGWKGVRDLLSAGR